MRRFGFCKPHTFIISCSIFSMLVFTSTLTNWNYKWCFRVNRYKSKEKMNDILQNPFKISFHICWHCIFFKRIYYYHYYKWRTSTIYQNVCKIIIFLNVLVESKTCWKLINVFDIKWYNHCQIQTMAQTHTLFLLAYNNVKFNNDLLFLQYTWYHCIAQL